MANNYLQFSEKLDGLTLDEADWILALAALARVGVEDSGHFDQESNPRTDLGRLALDLFEDELGQVEIDCRKQVGDDGRCSVWFWSEEAGDPFAVGKVVRAFFRNFRPSGGDLFILTWAEFCSKLRIGEFGGGALAVTRQRVEAIHLFNWAEQWRLELREKPR